MQKQTEYLVQIGREICRSRNQVVEIQNYQEGAFKQCQKEIKEIQNLALKRTYSYSPSSIQDLWKEFELMCLLKHKNIACAVAWVQQSDAIGFVVERAATDLFETVSQCNAQKELVPLSIVQRVLRDVARGLLYSHSCGIAHNDVKMENVLQMTDGRFVIADFGDAKRLDTNENAVAQRTRWAQRVQSNLDAQLIALISGKNVNHPVNEFKSDVFAFGIMAFLLFFSQYPFKLYSQRAHLREKCQYYNALENNDWTTYWQKFESSLARRSATDGSTIVIQMMQIIEQTLQHDSEKRASFEQILALDFFKESNSIQDNLQSQ